MTVLTKFDFAAVRNQNKWDWQTLTDGKCRKLEKGKDYTAKHAGAIVRKYAQSHQLVVKVSRGGPGDDHMIVQFCGKAKVS